MLRILEEVQAGHRRGRVIVTEPVGFHRFAYGRSPVRAVLSVAAVAMAAAGQFVLGGTAFAATTTTSVVKVAASDDAYVSTARPTYTFGANQSLIAGTAGGDRMLSYLKFTVGALPAGAKLSKVELSLTREDAKAVPALKLKQVAGTSWSQASLSYRTAPATGVELATGVASATTVGFDLTGTITAPGTYAFAVTSTSSTAIARLRASETGAPGPALNLTLTRTESTPPPRRGSAPWTPSWSRPVACCGARPPAVSPAPPAIRRCAPGRPPADAPPGSTTPTTAVMNCSPPRRRSRWPTRPASRGC
jgi:hypothetical protein